MRQQTTNDRLIALAATLVIAAMILLCLLYASLSWSNESLADEQQSEVSDEEIFLDAELVELGEPDAIFADKPAAAPAGEPEFSETPVEELVTPGDNPEPTPPADKMITQTDPSPVTVTEPSVSDREKSKISSDMAKGFSSANGKTDGKPGSNGAGGSGIGVKGSLSGRVLEKCPHPSVKLERKTVVVVKITVDEKGNVVEASFQSGTTDSKIKKACVEAARNAKWSESKGKYRQPGTITFTIIPT